MLYSKEAVAFERHQHESRAEEHEGRKAEHGQDMKTGNPASFNTVGKDDTTRNARAEMEKNSKKMRFALRDPASDNVRII